MAEKIKKITGMRLFMPIVCLFIVLLVNVIRTPDFFNITLKDGQLSGWLIDVINRGSELVILAIGMTFRWSGYQCWCCYGGCCCCLLSDFVRR